MSRYSDIHALRLKIMAIKMKPATPEGQAEIKRLRTELAAKRAAINAGAAKQETPAAVAPVEPTAGAVRAAVAITTKMNAMLRMLGVTTSDPSKTIPGPNELRTQYDMAVKIDPETNVRDLFDVAAGLLDEIDRCGLIVSPGLEIAARQVVDRIEDAE